MAAMMPSLKQLQQSVSNDLPSLDIRIDLSILAGRNLVPKDGSGPLKLGKKTTSDPYCVATYREYRFSTNTVKKNLNPEWNSHFTWIVEPVELDPSGTTKDNAVRIAIFDHDRGSLDDPMGEVVVRVGEPGSISDEWHPVQPCKGCAKTTGDVHVRIAVFHAAVGDAATAIQSSRRGQLARQAAAMKDKAAVRIQSAIRGRSSRRHRGVMDRAATAIQKTFRGFAVRTGQVANVVTATVAATAGAVAAPFVSKGVRSDVEQIEAPTPAARWWTADVGWSAVAASPPAPRPSRPKRKDKPPQLVMPTCNEASELYPEASETIGELRVEVRATSHGLQRLTLQPCSIGVQRRRAVSACSVLVGLQLGPSAQPVSMALQHRPRRFLSSRGGVCTTSHAVRGRRAQVLEATNLPGDWLSKADAYALLVFEGQAATTNIVDNDNSPAWGAKEVPDDDLTSPSLVPPPR
jgi:hypothetical protein